MHKRNYLVVMLVVVSMINGCTMGLERTDLSKWTKTKLSTVDVECEIPKSFLRSISVIRHKKSITEGLPEELGSIQDYRAHPIFLGAMTDSIFTLELNIMRLSQSSYDMLNKNKHQFCYYVPDEMTYPCFDLCEVRVGNWKKYGFIDPINVMWMRRDVRAPNGDVIVGTAMFLLYTKTAEEPLKGNNIEDYNAIRRILTSLKPLF